MRRRDLLSLVAGVTTAWPLGGAHGQQKTMPVVGWLWALPLSGNPAEGPMHDGLREAGYISKAKTSRPSTALPMAITIDCRPLLRILLAARWI